MLMMVILSSAFSQTMIGLLSCLPIGIAGVGFGYWVTNQNWETAIATTAAVFVLIIMTIMSLHQYVWYYDY